MSPKFKVKIFKKTKHSRYPNHIILSRKSSDSDMWQPYDDTVHLYFDKGVLAKFIHVQDAPKGKRIWDPISEKYVDLEPKHQIANEFIIKDGKKIHLKKPTPDSLYSFGYMAPDTTTITFCNDKTHPGCFDYFTIRMDLKGKWREPSVWDKYQNDKAAEIKEVYPHPKRSAYLIQRMQTSLKTK